MKPPIYSLMYLAGPYSHSYAKIKDDRLHAHIDAAHYLNIVFNIFTIEPIATSVMTERRYGIGSGYDYWQAKDRRYIDASEGVIVLCMEGVDQSVGTNDEIFYARRIGKPIYYFDSKYHVFISEKTAVELYNVRIEGKEYVSK